MPEGTFVQGIWQPDDVCFEENAQLVCPIPRDPVHRVDALRSSRHVQVMLGQHRIATTQRAVAMFETHVPTRWYIPRVDLSQITLRPSRRTWACPYKGHARYWHVQFGTMEVTDGAWSYDQPIPEATAIAGHIAFDPEQFRLDVTLPVDHTDHA